MAKIVTPKASNVNNNFYVFDSTKYFVVGGLYYSEESNQDGNIWGNLVRIFGENDQIKALGVSGGEGYIGFCGEENKYNCKESSVYANGNLTVRNNKVIVTNAYIGQIDGDHTGEIYGGHLVYHGHGTGLANGNIVITEGVYANFIFGGSVEYSLLVDEYYNQRKGFAQNNQVFVSNTILDNSIYAGYVYNAPYGTITNNTLTLSGYVEAYTIYGGFFSRVNIKNAIEFDEFSGNVLNIITPAEGGMKVRNNLGKFEIYRFVFDLNNPKANIGITANTLYLQDNMEGSRRSSRIESVDFLDGQSPEVGYQVVLFQAEEVVNEHFEQSSATGMAGVNLALSYDLTLEGPEENQIGLLSDEPKYKMIAHLKGLKAHPQMESPAQGWTAGLAFVTQGLEPVANRLNQIPMTGSLGDSPSDICPGLFFDASVGRSSYGSSGNFDLNTFVGVVGLNCLGRFSSGNLTMGGFVDFGQGDFSSEAILDGRLVKGEGNLKRIGGGVMAQFEFDPEAQKNISVESSLRFGHLRQDYSSQDFKNSQFMASFETESLYLGGHVGLSGKIGLSESSRLDLYGRYSHLWLQGDQSLVDGTAPIDFKNTSSQVGRVGARLNKNFTPKFGLKVGLGYEHEFNGVTKSETAGYQIKDVDIKGGTGLAEVGLSYKSAGPKPISLSLTAEGYAGKRKGLSASFNFSLAF
jgi:hypothetical protein